MKKNAVISSILFVLFAAFAIIVMKVDKAAIGPHGSEVGLSTLNKNVFDSIGTNDVAYDISKYVGLIPIAFAGVFAVLGLVQLVARKSLFKVDVDIIILGVCYVIFACCYVLFDKAAINYRPVLEKDGTLEASFPSTHCMIAVALTGFAMVQFSRRITNSLLKNIAMAVGFLIMAVIVVARLFSGVHWASDIFAGVVFGAALVYMYKAFLDAFCKESQND